VPIHVGSERSRTFQVHKSLVRSESEYFGRALGTGLRETAEQKCALLEEDPQLFGYFVEYLYRETWLYDTGESIHYSNLFILATLYAQGERLLASNFQNAISHKFTINLSKAQELPEGDICDLLPVCSTELPVLEHEDPLQAQIFCYAASRLSKLQKFDPFVVLLQQHPYVGVKICMRTGNDTSRQPELAKNMNSPMFRTESCSSRSD
jgi:hypothetical protein